MATKLPRSVDPSLLARRDATLEGIYAPEDLPRLAEAVEEIAEAFQVRMRFSHESGYGLSAQAEAQGAVMLRCERCLQPVRHEVHLDLNYVFVKSEAEAERLDDARDPVLRDEDGDVQLVAVLEDEFLLALPLLARHAPGECDERLLRQYLVDESSEPRADNPFAVLKNLKKN